MNKTDLQQISQLLDERLDEKLDEKLQPVYKKLDKHEKLLRSLKKDQDTMLNMLDREQTNQGETNQTY